jgi:putative transposase
MDEIITTLVNLSPTLAPRTLKQLTLIVEALLSMTGRVTMLGISRWTEKGGSYRTVQRFFKEKINWSKLRWQLIKQHTQGVKGIWLLIGDEVMVTKSGKETHGLGIFFHPFTTRRSLVCAF